VAKWYKEHIPRKGNDLTDEGLSLLDGMELWWEKQILFWVCHNSRKKDRMNIDGTFLPHQKGAISATFTIDWYLRKGESQDKMREWFQISRSVENSPSDHTQLSIELLATQDHEGESCNYWRHKITKAKSCK
jgi:hypothetical protein